MSTELAAVAALAYVALYVGHHVGDHIVQTERQAVGKGAPMLPQLIAGIHPWHGWRHCTSHVLGYTLTQAVAIVVAFGGLGVAVPWYGAAAALCWSGATHAVIDRGWLVRALLKLKGAQAWDAGRYLIDQSLHIALLLIGAVLVAAVTTALGAALAAVVGGVVVVTGLAVERRRLSFAGSPTPAEMAHPLLAKSRD